MLFYIILYYVIIIYNMFLPSPQWCSNFVRHQHVSRFAGLPRILVSTECLQLFHRDLDEEITHSSYYRISLLYTRSFSKTMFLNTPQLVKWDELQTNTLRYCSSRASFCKNESFLFFFMAWIVPIFHLWFMSQTKMHNIWFVTIFWV